MYQSFLGLFRVFNKIILTISVKHLLIEYKLIDSGSFRSKFDITKQINVLFKPIYYEKI